MIIRVLRLRHGRIALPRTLTPAINQRRYQSSLESSEAIERAEAPVFTQQSSTAQAQLDTIPNIRSVHINDPTHPVAQDYAFFQHQKARTQHLGSALEPHYKPHELLSNPPSPKDITLELLLASQAHLGHATSLWHPANARYIFGVRGNKAHGEGPIHIISLEATAAHLRRACKVVSGVTERGGLVLFVGTRQGHARPVVKAASMAGGCHLFTKWIPGSITNGEQILGRCAKKVVNELDEEVEGFEDQLGAKAALKPDLVVCLNPLENYILLHECGLNHIPTIGIIDTDANPTWVTYPIPANDDSLRTIQAVAGVLGRAGQEGQEKRLALARTRNIITYAATHGLEPPAPSERREKKRQPRQGRQVSQTPTPRPTPVPAEELNFPDDLEGVEVQQHEQDQELLNAAEQILTEQGNGPFAEASTAEQTNETSQAAQEAAAAAGETEFVAHEPEGAEDDVYSSSTEPIDESLLDDNYGDDHYAEEDFQQYGGLEQLEAAEKSRRAPPTSEPDLQATQAPESPIEQSTPASPIDQASEVAEELGEEEPSPAEPEAENPSDAAKPEPPVSSEGVEGVLPTEATTVSIEKEDGASDKPKSQ